ncbi:MAG TPA: S16 family serine protease [Gaiellaceae bacterium]|nr:S16 family serine protease [Gaiellaceae bacterium]
MKRAFSPGRLLALGLVLLAIFLGLLIAPSDDYIFLPDRAHPVAPLVTVPGGHDPRVGGVYYVDVIVRRAKLWEKLLGGMHEGADLYPASAINPPGVDDAQRRRIDLQDMQNSQVVASAVALRAAGKKVVSRPVGAKVELVQPGKPAVGKLEPDDVITAVDGMRVTSPADVFTAMRPHAPGDTVAFTIRRGPRTLVQRIRTVTSDDGTKRAVVGVLLEPAVDIRLPLDVRIDSGGVGGPSAGLAFALDILEELGHNVIHGKRIAATGELLANGRVAPIGGIKQKTIGAREADVDAFLVPAGENARDAKRYAHGLRIIPVESFSQALRALATVR